MSINLVDTIRKNLGYSEMHKVDPNIQEVKTDERSFGANSIAQAAIPAILCGLYNESQSEDPEDRKLWENNDAKWMEYLFGDKKKEVIQKIADYAGSNPETIEHEMEHIAHEAVRVIQQNVADKNDPNAIRNFLTGQRDTILLYLPASLQIGTLLNNSAMDDRTNKMEGPVSSFMHKIEKQFNSTEQNH